MDEPNWKALVQFPKLTREADPPEQATGDVSGSSKIWRAENP